MQTSIKGMKCVQLERGPDGGHPIEMDLDQDNSENNTHLPPSNSSHDQLFIHQVAPGPKTEKLSVEERLGRLSEYRVMPTEIESTAEATGSGGKADVVQASFKRKEGARGEQVAVKKLRCGDLADEKFSKEFVHEVELLARLSHKNIVQLVGFVEDLKNQKAWIVLSWESNGNVREFLASGSWEIPERISLIQDMFEGLQYLHTRQPPIRHGDLKSLNILVSSSCNAVITDFGSARVLRNDESRLANRDKMQNAGQVAAMDEGDSCPEVAVVAFADELTLTGPAWSLRWAAPEVVKEEARPGLASDIWSAGWVCWEMMTNKVPFEDVKHGGAVMLKVILGKVPMVRDTEVAQVISLCSLMTDCWKYIPENRPHVIQCCDEVRWMPSVPPLRGTTLDRKWLSPYLLMQMGWTHYGFSRRDKAAALFQRILANTESVVPQKVLAQTLKYLGDVHRAQCMYFKAEELCTRAQEIYTRIGNDQGRADTILGLGNIYYARSNYAEAEESYTRAQEIYTRIGNGRGRANTILGLGHVYRAKSKYAEAEESYTRAQEIYSRIGDYEGRVHTILGLGHVYRLQRKYPEAEESYGQAQQNYARIGSELGRANTILGLGDVYCAQSKYSEATESYRRAKEIYASIGDEQGRANTIVGMGHIYRLQCEYAKAEAVYTAAREAYSPIGYDQGRANAIFGLGDAYRLQSKYAEAEYSYTEAQELYTRIGDDLGRANAICGLGDVYCAQSQYAEAEKFYTRAQKIYARIGDYEGRVHTILGLGHVYRLQFKYAEAEETYGQAQQNYARIGSELGRAHTIVGSADVYCAQSKYAEAEESYTRAQEIYARIDHDQGLANTLDGLGDVYRAKCKYAEAEESYTRAREIYARIGDGQGRVHTILGLGHVYRLQRKYAESEESYGQAQQICFRMGSDLGQANAIFELGDVYRLL